MTDARGQLVVSPRHIHGADRGPHTMARRPSVSQGFVTYVYGSLAYIDPATGDFTLVPAPEDLEGASYLGGATDAAGNNWITRGAPSFDLSGRGYVQIRSGSEVTLLDFVFRYPEPIAYDAANDLMYVGHQGSSDGPYGGKWEVFDATTREHVRTLDQEEWRNATFGLLTPAGDVLYATSGTGVISALDVESGTWSTFFVQPDIEDEFGTPERFHFWELGVHPSGEVWTLAYSSFANERIWFFRISVSGELLERTAVMHWSEPNFHYSFNSRWDFDAGLVYWANNGDDKIGRYNVSTGEVIGDLFPNSAAQYTAAGGTAFGGGRPYWQILWGGTGGEARREALHRGGTGTLHRRDN